MKRAGWTIGLDVVLVLLVGLVMAWPARWGAGSRIAVAAVLVVAGALVVASRVWATRGAAADGMESSPAGEVVRQVIGTLTAVALVVMVVNWLVVGVRLGAGGQTVTTLQTWVGALELSAAASLLLVGVHLGLDLARFLPTASRTVAAAAVAVLTVVAAAGIVSLVTSNYPQWWSAPFAAARAPAGPFNPGQRTGGYPLPSGYPTDLPSGYPTAFPSDWPGTRPSGYPTAWPTTAPTSQPGAAPSQEPTATPGGGNNRTPGSGTRVNRPGGFPNQPGGTVATWPGLPQVSGSGVSAGRLAVSTIEYASIAGLVAALIGLGGLLLRRRRPAVPAPGPVAVVSPGPVPDPPVAPEAVIPLVPAAPPIVDVPVPGAVARIPEALDLVAPPMTQPPAGIAGPAWPVTRPVATPTPDGSRPAGSSRPLSVASTPPTASAVTLPVASTPPTASAVTPPPFSWPVPPARPVPPPAAPPTGPVGPDPDAPIAP